jgi:hypothetical protein
MKNILFTILSVVLMVFLVACISPKEKRELIKEFKGTMHSISNFSDKASVLCVTWTGTGSNTTALAQTVKENSVDWHKRLTDFWDKVWPFLIAIISTWAGIHFLNKRQSNQIILAMKNKLLNKDKNE